MKKLENIFFYPSYSLYNGEKLGDLNLNIGALKCITLYSCEEALQVVEDERYSDNSIIITDKTAILKKTRMSFLIWLNDNNCSDTLPQGAYCIEDIKDIDADYITRIFDRFHGIPWKIVETERLSIEEIAVEDVLTLKELYKATEITRYMEDLFPLEEEIEYTKSYIENVYGFYGYGMWLIKLKETQKVIGRVGIESKEGFDGLELGFMLGVEYWNKGYAHEACKAVISYAVEELENYDFRAIVHKDNSASVRLCKKLGFFEYAVEKDYIDMRLYERKTT